MGTGGTTALSSDEWIELYNLSSVSVDITGWRLKSLTNSDPDITIGASKSIGPFGFFLLERKSSDDNPDGTVSDISADWIYTGALNDGGEVLELRDKDDNLQDLAGSVASGSILAWYGKGDKSSRSSMERIDPAKVGDNSANWATNNGVTVNGKDAAGNPINGTPRARNSAYASQKPSTITDLAIDSASYFGQIKLIWSSPHDSDDPQSNLKYDLRFATRSFDTIAGWESATKVASSSMPSQAADYSQPQSSSFTIFDYNADYYFAIKTTDGASWSEISNQPQYTIKPAISDEISAFLGPDGPVTISWEFQAPDAFYINQPAIAVDGTIFFGAPNDLTGVPRLYAINQDGAKKWHHEPPFAGPYATPSTPTTSDDGAVYFGQFDPGSFVEALNSDGSRRWQYNVGDRVNSVAVDTEGDIFFTSESNVITKIGPSGEEKWRVFNSFTFGFTPIPAPGGDTFLSANNSGQPEYYRLSGSDGSVIWQKRASDSFAYSTFDPVYDKTSGKLYASATDYGFIFTLDPSTGAMTKDTFQRMARPTTKTAVSGSFLVVGVDLTGINPASGSAVYALNKSDKSVAWTFPVDSPVNKEIAVDAGGNLYFTTFNYATKNSKLYSLDKDGKERWVLDLGVSTELYPVLGENAVFMGVGGASGGKLVKIADY